MQLHGFHRCAVSTCARCVLSAALATRASVEHCMDLRLRAAAGTSSEAAAHRSLCCTIQLLVAGSQHLQRHHKCQLLVSGGEWTQ